MQCCGCVVAVTEGYVSTQKSVKKQREGYDHKQRPKRGVRDEHPSQNNCPVALNKILYSSALWCLGEGVPSAVAHMVALQKVLHKKGSCYDHRAVCTRQHERVATRHTRFFFVV